MQDKEKSNPGNIINIDILYTGKKIMHLNLQMANIQEMARGS